MRRLTVLLCLAALAAACGSGEANTEPSATAEGAGDPAAAVAELLDALTEGRAADTEAVVDESQLAILTFIEGASGEEVARLIADGVPADVRRSFWNTFTESLPQFAGETVGRLHVGDVESVQLETSDFAAVSVEIGDTGRAADWLVRMTDDGWKVDLLATFGIAVAPNLWAWSETLPQGEPRQAVLDAIDEHRPSLQVARDRADTTLPQAAFDALDALIAR